MLNMTNGNSVGSAKSDASVNVTADQMDSIKLVLSCYSADGKVLVDEVTTIENPKTGYGGNLVRWTLIVIVMLAFTAVLLYKMAKRHSDAIK